jgi:hypothetical protein
LKEILNKLEEVLVDIYDLDIKEDDYMNKINANVSVKNAIKSLEQINLGG